MNAQFIRTLWKLAGLVTLLVSLVVLLAPPTAHAQSSAPLPSMPTANGYVLVVVPDGAGGVYIGGMFTQLTPVGGGPAVTRNYIARINADGSIHPWNPNANERVWSLAVSGNTVYAGGYFTTIGGATRNRIAALDATVNTNNATAWDPNANSPVLALTVSGSVVYAGGFFTTIGGLGRSRIAALDATTGNATAWNPNADSIVYALAVSGSTVYAGGFFTNIGGQPRNYIAALDAAGNATTWNPNANNWVYALAVSGSTVYAGGVFTNIGGQGRNRIAALEATTGNATAWNPNANDTVLALAVSGSTVYAGGVFTNIGGATRNHIAALDATVNTNNATAWNPNMSDAAEDLAVSGSTVYVGGYFTTIGGATRTNFAAFAAPYLSNLVPSSGTLSPAFAWNTTSYSANVANSVASITVTPTTPDATAVIRVNGTIVASGTASGAIPLNVGANTITITITSWDNRVTTYTVTVTRGAAPPPAEVPEADTLLLLGGGIGGLGVWLRYQWSKRRKKAH